MFFELVDELNAILRKTADSLMDGTLDEPVTLSISPARDLAHGDLATNAAMVLAK
ncbi:MAG: hypothetical protein RBU29_15165, partial [bacterium]|nr:hypothetical protein [bacterium]